MALGHQWNPLKMLCVYKHNTTGVEYLVLKKTHFWWFSLKLSSDGALKYAKRHLHPILSDLRSYLLFDNCQSTLMCLLLYCLLWMTQVLTRCMFSM